MTVSELKNYLSTLPPDLETTVGEIKVIEGENYFRRAALVPIYSSEMRSLVTGIQRTGGSNELCEALNLDITSIDYLWWTKAPCTKQ